MFLHLNSTKIHYAGLRQAEGLKGASWAEKRTHANRTTVPQRFFWAEARSPGQLPTPFGACVKCSYFTHFSLSLQLVDPLLVRGAWCPLHVKGRKAPGGRGGMCLGVGLTADSYTDLIGFYSIWSWIKRVFESLFSLPYVFLLKKKKKNTPPKTYANVSSVPRSSLAKLAPQGGSSAPPTCSGAPRGADV